jgi:hypothetical protein
MEYTRTMKTKFTIETQSVPAGFFSHLLVKGVDDRKVHDCRTSSLKSGGWCHLASNPRAKFSKSEPESQDLLRKTVEKEVLRLEKHGDLRPSQVLRLELLKEFLG